MDAVFLDQLRATGAQVIDDPVLCANYGQDWTRRFSGPVGVVVKPETTQQVSDVLRRCFDAGLPVIPQGGNTSLVGGAVPHHDDPPVVVLSTIRLRSQSAVDLNARAVTVGAGMTVADIHEIAEAAGLVYGVDLAARESATIGGTIATNAGGIRVCAYGMTRAQVIGVEYVLADGRIVTRLDGLPKDNTGYDLGGLITGSEGTLAVITQARLRLHTKPPSTDVCLVGVNSLHDALALIAHLPATSQLYGAEIVDRPIIELTSSVTGSAYPLEQDWPYVLLLEATDIDLPDDADAVMGWDAKDQRKLWEFRERAAEAIATLGVVHKFDVSVPHAHLDELMADIRQLVPSPEDIMVFGHIGDSNLHIEMLNVDPEDYTLDAEVLRTVSRLRGVVSAEHGVGRAKAPWLHYSRTPAEIDLMWGIKQVFDPRGILNPGALLDPARIRVPDVDDS